MSRSARYPPPALGIFALLALGACAAGALLDWQAYLRCWLVAVLVLGTAPLAALAVLMTHGLTGGRWGEDSAVTWRALAALMPLFLAALLPLLAGLDALFPWAQPAADLAEPVRRKLGYLNVPFLLLRTAGYALCWLALPWLLGVFSGPARRVHAPGLIVWVLSISFFGVDWLMSLEPEFYSDIYGLLLMSGLLGAGMAAGLLLLPPLEVEVQADLANLWLAVLVGWLVMAFSQYILIWSGNLPAEISWLVHRRAAAWPWIGWLAFLLFFLVPFAILLSSSAKRRRGWLTLAAASCIAGHLLYVAWLVLPAFAHWRPAQTWLLPLALVALGSLGGWVYQRRRATWGTPA